MSDDLDNNKNTAEPTNPSPDQGQTPAPGEEASVFKLRETLIGEEQDPEKLPKKTGFLKRVTGALHLRPVIDRKTGQLPPAEEKLPLVDQPVESSQEALQENIPGTDTSISPSESEETTAGENDQKSPWEGSIFDLLAQVQRGGLEGEELPEAERKATAPLSDGTEGNLLQGQAREVTLPPSPKEETGPQLTSGGSTLQDDLMTTSSLASRLWGLQELPSDQDKFPPSEPEPIPFMDEKAQTQPQESGEKRSFLDRLTGQHNDEKDIKPLQIDDDEVINRISRTTGSLHAPPDSLMPGRSSRGSRMPGELQPDFPEEGESSEAGRFTYYPQEGGESTPNVPGGAAVDTNIVSPFVKGPSVNQPTPDADDVSPFSSPGEGWVPPQTPSEGTEVPNWNPLSREETTPAGGELFDIDQFLEVSKPEAQAELEETPPTEEDSWNDTKLEEIRSIALAQPDEEETGAFPSPENLPEEETPSPERKIPKKPRSWWASLSTFEKILLGITALLITSIGVIAILTASIFGPHKPAGTIQLTITPSALPQPSSLILPGGWSFPLHASGLDTPLTSQGSGAWLQGSEVRRVVELPWNKQTEAVAHSLGPGDLIQLVFDDNTTISYKVQQLLRVSATDTSILTDVKPSLAIILSGEKADNRWVIIAMP